jgi:hypothetical protein
LTVGREWERRDLLPGPSVFEWSGWALIGGAICVGGGIGAVVCAFTLVASSHLLDPATVSFLVLFTAGFGWLWICNGMGKLKSRRELAADYTTSAQGHYEVERRHSPTGVVMREAGAPGLTREQWANAMKRVREYQASPSPGGAEIEASKNQRESYEGDRARM